MIVIQKVKITKFTYNVHKTVTEFDYYIFIASGYQPKKLEEYFFDNHYNKT